MIKKCIENSQYQFNCQDDTKPEWSNLLVSIKVFIEWLLCNIKLWYPLPDQLSPDLGPNPNRWQILIDLFNLCSQYSPKLTNPNIQNNLYPLKLEEDIELAGFLPLLTLPRDDEEITASTASNSKVATNSVEYVLSLNEAVVEAEKAKKRMDKILLFADYLCGLEKQPLVEYDVKMKAYSLIAVQLPIRALVITKMAAARTTSTCSTSSLKSDEGGNVNKILILFLNSKCVDVLKILLYWFSTQVLLLVMIK